MKYLTYIGATLVVIGIILVAASTGAFDSATADRGVTVETAGDDNALLALDYPSDDRTLALDSGTSDGGGECIIIIGCSDYEYNSEELVSVTDNTPSNNLIIEDVDYNYDDDLVESLEYDETAVWGDFACPASGSFIGGSDQDEASTSVELEIVASSSEVTVDLERSVTVNCIRD